MDPQEWLQRALDELAELAPDASLDADRASRTAVLVGRLLGSPTGPRPSDALVRRLPDLLRQASGPTAQALLEELHEALAASDDPAGPVHDGLLDVDDSVTLAGLRGDDVLAADLAGRAAGLVALYAERVLPLHAFSSMRLQTVRDDSPVWTVWESVRRAPAHVVAEALPAPIVGVAAPARAETGRVVPMRRPPARFGVPPELLQVAATTAPMQVRLEAAGRHASISEEDGRQRLEVWHVTPTSRLTLRMSRIADGAELAVREIPLSVGGRTGYADLGPATGPENLLQAILREVGAPPDSVAAELTVSDA